MAHATNVTLHGPSLGERLQALSASWAERRARARLYRSTLNELRALNDRELADIGITRANIPQIAEMAAGKRT